MDDAKQTLQTKPLLCSPRKESLQLRERVFPRQHSPDLHCALLPVELLARTWKVPSVSHPPGADANNPM